MSEPIASRSHFNIVYDQDSDRYYLMDAGSKWGTFVKICSSVTLSCGNWIRVGGVEFIIRYCGGGCACRKRHAHYRLQSLRLLREQATRMKDDPASSNEMKADEPPSSSLAGDRLSRSTGDVARLYEEQVARLPSAQSSPLLAECAAKVRDSPCDLGGEALPEEDRNQQLQDELALLLSSRQPRGWTTALARFCQQAAMRHAGTPVKVCDDVASSRDEAGNDDKQEGVRRCPRSSLRLQPSVANATSSTTPSRLTLLPIAPLELDFISGPRMGEKMVLNERVCTLGRGEGNTIQVSDSQLASVSRVHCIFEYSGNRWHMRDNGSTNGTWRRLSCVLEPSEPILLSDGVSIQAGVHEFLVEEMEMRYWWAPTVAQASFEENHERWSPHPHHPQFAKRESGANGVDIRSVDR